MFTVYYEKAKTEVLFHLFFPGSRDKAFKTTVLLTYI